MSKKKGKQKSGREGAEDKKREEVEVIEERAESDPEERALFLNQIQHLTEQLDRYKLKCDEQQQQKKHLDSLYSSLEKEKKDIVEYLKHSLLEKEKEAEQLSEQLEGQRQAAAEERDAHQLILDQTRQQLQQQIEALRKERDTLETRLELVERFEKQREQMTADMVSLENRMSLQEQQHNVVIHEAEIRVLVEKDRLQRELDDHREAQAEHVQNLVKQKLPEVTKQVLQENMELKADLGELRERTAGWMMENDELKSRNRQLRVDMENLEEMFKELNRKCYIQQKVVEQLTEKSRQLREELDVCQEKHKQLQTERKHNAEEAETLRQNQASLSERCRQQSAEVSRLEAELRDTKRAKSMTDRIVQDATVTLRQTLLEAPDGQKSEVTQWKQLMQNLLVLLDSHTFETTGRASTMDPDSRFRFQLARYRTGDLGFVPPPATKHIHTRRTPAHSLPPLRKSSREKLTTLMKQCQM